MCEAASLRGCGCQLSEVFLALLALQDRFRPSQNRTRGCTALAQMPYNTEKTPVPRTSHHQNRNDPCQSRFERRALQKASPAVCYTV